MLPMRVSHMSEASALVRLHRANLGYDDATILMMSPSN